jgi:hypothetical protein
MVVIVMVDTHCFAMIFRGGGGGVYSEVLRDHFSSLVYFIVWQVTKMCLWLIWCWGMDLVGVEA